MKSNRFPLNNTFLKIIIKLAAFICFFAAIVKPAEETGPTTQYKIPSYYGSRDLDFDTKGFAVASNYSSFYWSHGVDIDDQTDLSVKKYYVIDKTDKTIKQITDSFIVTVIASTSGGYRDGDIRNSQFNNSLALVFYRQNKYNAAVARYKKIIVLQNDSEQCKQQKQNCQDTTLGDNSKIDLKRLAEYYDIPTAILNNLPNKSEYLNEALIIADTDNHCIRKIDLVTKITTTIAGICTQKGFKDGPLGTNLMYSPSSLGVDEQGIIFFYDGQYDYIRMIDPITTFVSTLLKGACREDVRSQSKKIYQKMSNRGVLCYKNWLNINAEPSGHKYEENLLSICQLQQSLCSNTKTSDTAT